MRVGDVLRDARLQSLARELCPGHDPADVISRAAWSVLIEPGDAVAGTVISHLGAARALTVALPGHGREDVRSVTSDTSRFGGRALCEGRKRWAPRADPVMLRQAMERAARCGARLLVPGCPEWPSLVDDLGVHAPVALWARGEVSLVASQPSVAIVGARASTSYGEHVTAEIAGDLARDGVTIVSGGAYGIDGAAHRAALGVDGRTVAYLAGGVDRTYPAGHAGLFLEIRRVGALVSEVPCGTPPTRWRFLARNRLIAAGSQATVVVEAGWRSGSLNTAGHAAELGRPLAAVPGPVTSAASAGCHRLMREYAAQCVTDAAEVRELFGVETVGEPGAADVGPGADEIRLRDALVRRTPRDSVELARRAGLATERVRALLGMWELEGTVRRSADGWLTC